MSTNDVPGHDPKNRDELSMGCWGEHDDGSLIFVQSTEGGRVIYMMFDLSVDPVVEYRDAMPEKGFKEHFSWKDKNSIKWTWHDKTPFPWDRVIKKGSRDGIHYASADDQLSAASKVAKSLRLKMEEFNPDKYDHLTETVRKGKTSNRILNAFQAAIDELRK
jgi:hypothetical protein